MVFRVYEYDLNLTTNIKGARCLMNETVDGICFKFYLSS